MRLIADGIVDREGIPGLAKRLGYSERHVHRQLVSVVGVGPLALARAQRAQTARVLLETTHLSIAEVAFASGFRSVRQFNDSVRAVFATTPGGLRVRARHGGARPVPGAITLRLPYRSPLDGEGLLAFLEQRAVPGIEEVVDRTYRRSLRLPHGSGVVELEPNERYVKARFRLGDLRDLAAAVQRSRTLLDLDSDPQAVLEALGRNHVIGAIVRAAPGRRVPGHVDAHELAIRAVLGQQVSLAGAATLAGRIVLEHGEPLEQPMGAVTHLFPSAAQIAAVDPVTLPMPNGRKRALITLAGQLATGELVLDPGADRGDARRRLLALPGLGPWTTEYIAMRALCDPDAFPCTDLGIRHALALLTPDSPPTAVERVADAWRPYRAYAAQHLWAHLAIARSVRRPGQVLAA